MRLMCIRVRPRVLSALVCWGMLLAAQWSHAGWHVGALECTPFVEVAGIFDDNVFLASRGNPDLPVVDDIMARVRPGIGVRYLRASSDVSLDYSTEFLYYRHQSQLDSSGRNHSIRLSGAGKVSPVVSIALADDVTLGTDVARITREQALLASLGIIPSGREYVLNATSGQLVYALSRRWTLTANLRYGYQHFGSLDRAATGDGADEGWPATTDHLWDGTVSTGYAWHRNNSVVWSVGFSYYDYRGRGISRIYSTSVGDRWRVTPRLELSVDGGASFMNERGTLDAGIAYREERVNPLANLTVAYETAHTRWWAALSYLMGASSGFGETVETRAGAVGIRYTGLEDTTVGVSARISQSLSTEKAGGAEGRLDVVNYVAGVSVERKITDWLAATADYSFIDQHAVGGSPARTGETYKDNRVTLGIVASVPDIR